MTKVTIQLPDAVCATLDAIGRRQRQPVEEVAGALIEKALLLEQLRRMRQELRPCAEAAGFGDDDDVFKAVS